MYQICLCKRAEQYLMYDKQDVKLLTTLLEDINTDYVVSTIEKPITVCMPSDFGWLNSNFNNWRC